MTTEVRTTELDGAHPESEFEALQQLLAEVRATPSHDSDCGEVEKLLAGVWGARSALDRVEHALQTAHLACCILPGVSAPEELALGLNRLAARGVGGLVAVEQQQGLDEYIARGTPLDAQLSANLLESLFHPGSTLHDGAVIVWGTRIMAAGVFLPVMAERRDPTHGRLLGGRHRAAVALSRLTDALVFVVSEETREVSLVVHGLLHQGVHLEAILRLDDSAVDRRLADAQGTRFSRLRSGLGWLARRRLRSGTVVKPPT